jgi:hypothetical protein
MEPPNIQSAVKAPPASELPVLLLAGGVYETICPNTPDGTKDIHVAFWYNITEPRQILLALTTGRADDQKHPLVVGFYQALDTIRNAELSASQTIVVMVPTEAEKQLLAEFSAELIVKVEPSLSDVVRYWATNLRLIVRQEIDQYNQAPKH